jgi:hypothetical protein
MNLNKPKSSMTASEKLALIKNPDRAKLCEYPRKVWAEDGHLFIEGHDGYIILMKPEVALYVGRMLAEVGTDALINKVIDDAKT